jgi:hypothetical protein
LSCNLEYAWLLRPSAIYYPYSGSFYWFSENNLTYLNLQTKAPGLSYIVRSAASVLHIDSSLKLKNCTFYNEYYAIATYEDRNGFNYFGLYNINQEFKTISFVDPLFCPNMISSAQLEFKIFNAVDTDQILGMVVFPKLLKAYFFKVQDSKIIMFSPLILAATNQPNQLFYPERILHVIYNAKLDTLLVLSQGNYFHKRNVIYKNYSVSLCNLKDIEEFPRVLAKIQNTHIGFGESIPKALPIK